MQKHSANGQRVHWSRIERSIFKPAVKNVAGTGTLI